MKTVFLEISEFQIPRFSKKNMRFLNFSQCGDHLRICPSKGIFEVISCFLSPEKLIEQAKLKPKTEKNTCLYSKLIL